MTEKQVKTYLETKWEQGRVVETILLSGVGRQERSEARNVYNRIKSGPHTPKDKKQLWRDLGKLLSINDIEFVCGDDNSVFIKNVSSIRVKEDEARGISVDCLRSFCTKLGMGRTGHLKKDELLKRMHEISLLVASKRTPYNAEIHRLLQRRLWTEEAENKDRSDRDGDDGEQQSSTDGSSNHDSNVDKGGDTTVELLLEITRGGNLHMTTAHTDNFVEKNNSVVQLKKKANKKKTG
jgi:hypothetical protein